MTPAFYHSSFSLCACGALQYHQCRVWTLQARLCRQSRWMMMTMGTNPYFQLHSLQDYLQIFAPRTTVIVFPRVLDEALVFPDETVTIRTISSRPILSPYNGTHWHLFPDDLLEPAHHLTLPLCSVAQAGRRGWDLSAVRTCSRWPASSTKSQSTSPDALTAVSNTGPRKKREKEGFRPPLRPLALGVVAVSHVLTFVLTDMVLPQRHHPS